METIIKSIFLISILLFSCAQPETTETSNKVAVTNSDPLPSWNDVNSKKEIIAFVNTVTDKDSPNFIPIADRIATFDNDGNLWSEQPIYFQLFFVVKFHKVVYEDLHNKLVA